MFPRKIIGVAVFLIHIYFTKFLFMTQNLGCGEQQIALIVERWLVGSLLFDAFSVTRIYSIDDGMISEI
jgi:hypothetical protein